MPLASGHEAVPLEDETAAKQDKTFVGFKHGYVRLTPGKWFLPMAFTNFADKIHNFQWRDSDVLVMSYPRSGAAWAQELVWTLRSNPDLNNPMAAMPILARSPYLEMDMMMDGKKMPQMGPEHPLLQGFLKLCPGGDPAKGVNLQIVAASPDPRGCKTHLPLSLHNPKILDTAKIVYVARNPKDVLMSLHHQCRLLTTFGYSGTLEQFVQFFTDDEVVYGPYWLHLKEAWEKRNHPNMHLVFYEDLKADLDAQVKKLNDFLGTGLSEEQLQNVAKHCSFNEMKARDNLTGTKSSEDPMMVSEVAEKDGGFFRKGEVGSWKENLTAEMVEKVDQWTQKNLSEISFKYAI